MQFQKHTKSLFHLQVKLVKTKEAKHLGHSDSEESSQAIKLRIVSPKNRQAKVYTVLTLNFEVLSAMNRLVTCTILI